MRYSLPLFLSATGFCSLLSVAPAAVDISFIGTVLAINAADQAAFPTENQTFVFSNVGTYNSSPFDAVVQFTSFRNSSEGLSIKPFGDSVNGGSLGFDLRGRASSSQHAYFNIRFVVPGSASDSNPTGTIFPITSTVRIQSFDLDSNVNQNFTDVFGFRNTDSTPNRIFVSPDTFLEQAGFEPAVASSGTLGLAAENVAAANILVNETNAQYTMWRAQQINGSWSSVANIPFADTEAQVPYTVTFEYNSVITPLHFVWGATGPSTNQNSRGIRVNANDPLFVAIPEPRSAAAFLAAVALLFVGRRRWVARK